VNELYKCGCIWRIVADSLKDSISTLRLKILIFFLYVRRKIIVSEITPVSSFLFLFSYWFSAWIFFNSSLFLHFFYSFLPLAFFALQLLQALIRGKWNAAGICNLNYSPEHTVPFWVPEARFSEKDKGYPDVCNVPSFVRKLSPVWYPITWNAVRLYL